MKISYEEDLLQINIVFDILVLMHIYHKAYGEKNKRVIFLLTGWHTRLWMYHPFSKILETNGFYCITYAYNNDILSPNTQQTVENFTKVRDDVLQKIEELKRDGLSNFSVFGTSLGSLIAIMIAHKSSDVSKIILNTTTIDGARTVWSWDHVKTYFKKDLIRQHFTLEKLQKVWASISPEHNIDNLKRKKFLIFLSKKDQIMPYSLGRELVEKLEEYHYECKVIRNKHWGHALTCYYNLINSKVYLKFLNQ